VHHTVPTRVRDIDWSTWRAQDLATLVFVISGGRILLIRKKRGLGAGKINGPGGRLGPGETPFDCAVREVQEELRITPIGLEHLGETLFQFVDGYSIHVFVYRAFEFQGEPTETDEAAPIWAPLDAIPFPEMWADDRIWLPWVIDGKRFMGRFIFDSDAMLDHELDVEP
jgi:8-oxo-dGTP diphosphatase